MPVAATPCVMIVDDEVDLRELLRELLELRGYSVCTAANGLEALELLRSPTQICFVLTDVRMPVLDGLGLLATMAAEPALHGIPVCVTTATPRKVPPGVDCLPKPVDLRKLYALLDRHCVSPTAS